MELSLRRATPGDLGEVMALEVAGFVPGIVEEPDVFAQRIAVFPEGFLLVQEGTRTIGYVCAEIWSHWSPQAVSEARYDLGHDITKWHVPFGDTLYVASMTVAPSARGGVGRRLFRLSLDRWFRAFPLVRQVVLIVNEHWSAARHLYETEGFEEVERLPDFFRPQEGPRGTALVMRKETGRQGSLMMESL